MPHSTRSTPKTFDQAVQALLGVREDSEATELQLNVERVAKEFDARALESFSEPLIDHLALEPESIEGLQALLVLGLAHPKFFARHHAKLMQEGRRLASLLEQAGDIDGAQALLESLSWKNPDDRKLERDLAKVMKRTGNADHLIERYLRRAETAIGEGRRDEAVSWLREALTIDRSRRDVSRMIRDLQFDQKSKRRSLRTFARSTLLIVLLVGGVAGGVYRERWVTERLDSLLATEARGLDAKRERLAALDVLIQSNPLWYGAFRASGERKRLREEIAVLEAERADERLQSEVALHERRDMADSAHLRARMETKNGNYAKARLELLTALECAPEGWPLLGQVQADLAALDAALGTVPEGPPR